ncbi:ABC transporter substrate-binding protein [Aminiphilus circumscriptus]|uniref:ABC transporter substrate-binding protein n=1 Tax=Aminiphilus circumscriptus TaxID=290732 RepID=UPI00068423E0|nr:ABC transporter substrate-binding protein [Aminiphilus circumscriptus]
MDLSGRRIMLEPQSEELLAFLRREGLPPDAVTRTEHSFDYRDLLEGRAEAISAYSTYEPYFLDREHVPFVLYTPLDAGIDFYGDVLFTSEVELAAHPDRVRPFREASLRGWRHAMANPEKAGQTGEHPLTPRRTCWSSTRFRVAARWFPCSASTAVFPGGDDRRHDGSTSRRSTPISTCFPETFPWRAFSMARALPPRLPDFLSPLRRAGQLARRSPSRSLRLFPGRGVRSGSGTFFSAEAADRNGLDEIPRRKKSTAAESAHVGRLLWP